MLNRRTYMRFAAWVLLVAYLPLLVSSAVHMHQPTATMCDDCAHHVEHPSHFAESAVTMQDCMFCHVASIVYFGVALTALVVPLVMVVRERIRRCLRVFGTHDSGVSLRAPPVC